MTSSPILPGSTIGILGGGQLGRMTAMAARSLGYRVQVLDPDPSCPARFVVDSCFEASWDDARAAADLARGCDVVTLEIEQVSLSSLRAAAKYAPVRPSASVLEIIQNRIHQKNWLRKNNFPVGCFQTATTEEELIRALRAFGGCCFIKAARGGYDGRSQVRLQRSKEDAYPAAWKEMGGRPCVVEEALDLASEISVLVARTPNGKCAVYPPALNHHEKQILDWSVIPAELSLNLQRKSQEIAQAIATQIAVEGLLAVEMFLLKDGTLLVNELAPRTHNSYHASERACATSQFEQAVRSICDLPLGDTSMIRPAAIANLLGDIWLGPKPPAFDAALAITGVRLHLYEKHLPRPGRKMGHLSAIGDTPQQAVDRVLRARTALAE